MSNLKKIDKLWGGNFRQLPNQTILDFTSAWDIKSKKPYDERLIPYDIAVNLAHAKMLAKQGIISQDDTDKLIKGLNEIKKLYAQGKFNLDPSKEDVHTNIEAYLIEKYGIDTGGRLHTARSRNDQIACDMRLYLKDANNKIIQDLSKLIDVLSKLKVKHNKVQVPGFTHHRPAVLTTLGIVFDSFKQCLKRDLFRFQNWLKMYNKNPLGSATGYGTSFNIDRRFTAQELGFNQVEESVLDPITNRGEDAAALAFNIAMLMKHLSQMAQTLILWSMPQFNYLRLPDQFCTGSSIMPHKKNPDVLEAIKAKTAVSFGILNSLLIINSSNLIGYNRDMQWSKYLIMDLIDEIDPVLSVMSDLLISIRINKKRLVIACQRDYLDLTFKMEREVQQNERSLREVKQRVERGLR